MLKLIKVPYGKGKLRICVGLNFKSCHKFCQLGTLGSLITHKGQNEQKNIHIVCLIDKWLFLSMNTSRSKQLKSLQQIGPFNLTKVKANCVFQQSRFSRFLNYL